MTDRLFAFIAGRPAGRFQRTDGVISFIPDANPPGTPLSLSLPYSGPIARSDPISQSRALSMAPQKPSATI